jgi:cytoskeletal protein CcmA (bactofilin family)
VICSGSLNLSGSEICKAQIQTESLTVERGASLKFLYPLELGEGFIDGRVEGDVFCRGTLRIGRHGILLGDVDARSLIVDRGGIFSGSVRVAVSVQMIEDQEPVAAPQPEPPGEVEPWLPGMALGAA